LANPEYEYESCLDLFKKKKCNLDHPIGNLCQELRLCISQHQNPSIDPSYNIKMMNIEEFVENLLLMITGMGMVGTVRKLVRARVLV
jgi:hypothetical protein